MTSTATITKAVSSPFAEPRDFAAFMEPGRGKIACSYSVRPYGDRRTLFTYECAH